MAETILFDKGSQNALELPNWVSHNTPRTYY